MNSSKQHIAALITLYGKLMLWGTEIHLRTWRTPGLRLSTRLGLTLPTPTEIRVIAHMFRHVDMTDVAEYIDQALMHACALIGKPYTPFFDEATARALFSNEAFYQGMLDFADVYERENKYNLFTYIRATHNAQNRAFARELAKAAS